MSKVLSRVNAREDFNVPGRRARRLFFPGQEDGEPPTKTGDDMENGRTSCERTVSDPGYAACFARWRRRRTTGTGPFS